MAWKNSIDIITDSFTPYQPIEMTNKDTLAEMIEYRNKKWEHTVKHTTEWSIFWEFLEDLQTLQAEQPKQEADIDKIQELIEKHKNYKRMSLEEEQILWIIISDLTKLQSLPQEADIHYCHSWIIDWVSWWKDWIYKAIRRYEELEWEPPHYSNFRTAIEQNLPKHLTQKTTVHKDGEVVCPKCKAEKEWRCPNCWAIWLHWCVWKHYPWYPTSISAQWAWCMWCNKYVNIPHQCPITMKYQSS